MNKQLTYTTLLPLLGKRFKTREELDDAFYPYFGPLQIIFPGEGHRDLVDRLIGAKWIVIENNEWVVKLEDLTLADMNKPTVESKILDMLKDEAVPPTEVPEITYQELQMLIDIGASINGAPTSKFVMTEQLVNDLIKKGLVELTNNLSSTERTFAENTVKNTVKSALIEVASGEYQNAINSLQAAMKAQERIDNIQWVYVLTTTGKTVMDKLSTAKIKI